MELFCSFDLPVLTAKQRRAYRRFHKFLENEGFVMFQESLYCRMIPSGHPLEALKKTVMKHAPDEGSVVLITVTEKQFENMVFVTGSFNTNVISSKEKVVVL